MTRISWTGLVLAAACAVVVALAARAQPMPGPWRSVDPSRVELYTSMPVYTPGDEGGWNAAQRNNTESRRYEALLRDSPEFRQQRMMRECGSISEPAMHQGCVDSFGDRTVALRMPGRDLGE